MQENNQQILSPEEQPIKKRSFLRKLGRKLLSFSVITVCVTGVSDLGIRLLGLNKTTAESGSTLSTYESPTLKFFGKLLSNDAYAGGPGGSSGADVSPPG